MTSQYEQRASTVDESTGSSDSDRLDLLDRSRVRFKGVETPLLARAEDGNDSWGSPFRSAVMDGRHGMDVMDVIMAITLTVQLHRLVLAANLDLQ